MSDVFSNRKRSAVMALIRSRGNKATELRLIAIFRANRITGWRRGSKLTGRPDFVFPKLKLAVFVDGCFWHGCPKHATQPRNNAAFWAKKLSDNQTRDRFVTRMLRKKGWEVLRIWEHELSRKNAPRLLNRLRRELTAMPRTVSRGQPNETKQ
ncbi:MAG: very short patch repair endonuclease [Opitutaceae bacterium]